MKYDIPSSSFDKYCKSLVNRIWVLIPLREENCSTLNIKIERINRELSGMIKNMPVYDDYIITVIHLLENLTQIDDFTAYRSDVLRCCGIIKKLGGGNNV